MSNSASSPVVLRIQQSALVFVVLLLALGAMILAANNIDPNAAVRGDVRYTLWTSPDGLFSVEYPAGWTPQPVTAPLRYAFTTQDQIVGTFGFRTGKEFNLDATDIDKNPQAAIDKITSSLPQGATSNSQTVIVDGVRSAKTLYAVDQTDQTTGQTQVQAGELWLVPLDGTHFFLSNIMATSDKMTEIKPLWDHVMNSVHINRAAAFKALGIGVATATPTAVPTQAATEGATANATAAATSAATAAP